MKKFLSILLSFIMIFSLFTPVFAETAKPDQINLIDDFFGNIQRTSTSLSEINKLSQSLLRKIEPVVMNMMLDSENWGKAKQVILDKFVSEVDGTSVSHKPADKEAHEAAVPEETKEPAENIPADNTAAEAAESPAKTELPEADKSIKFNTFNDFISIIKKYLVVDMSTIDEKSQAIADSAEFQYTVMKDGKKTVYIFVNIEDNPEILNINLLRETVKKLYERQNLEYSEGADVLMSYEHMAGELALHAIMYAVSYEYVRFTGKTEGRMYDYWQKAREACLNIDEDRLPNEIFKIVGLYVTGVFLVNIYNVYKVFSNF